MAEIKVTITGGKQNLGESLTVPLDGSAFVGRSRTCAIRFARDEPGVSRLHLEILQEEGRVWVRNLKEVILVQGSPVQEGERHELHAGDVLELGAHGRFRIDAVNGLEPEKRRDDALSLTGMTRPVDLTEATRPVDLTEATRPVDLTEATRPVDLTEATRPVDLTEATRPVDLTEATRPMPSVPTEDFSIADRPTEAVTSDALSAGGTQTNNGTKTVAIGRGEDGPTDRMPEWLIKQLNEQHRARELHKRKMRQSLLAFAMVLFCVVVGVIVYVRWPKGEKVLSVPLNAKGEPDVDRYTAATLHNPKAFVVDYPRNSGIKKSELSNGRGLEVSTLIGKDRNVPFRLRLDRSENPEELTRSLTACAQARMKLEEKSGTVFHSPAEWPAGVYFFESEYPTSCHSPRLQRGTRFYRTEYETVRGNLKWWGTLFVFRDGETVFAFWREIPAGEWERGKKLFRVEANLEFYPDFLQARWESPGFENLVTKHTPEQLTAEIRRELDLPNPRMSQWPRLKREVDTLMVLTWNKRPQNEAAKTLLARFRKQQDSAYIHFVLNFDLAKKSGADEERLVSIREDCRRVFGNDPFDRRFLMIGDPERWSCQKEKN